VERSSSNQQSDLEVLGRPTTRLGEPGPTGSPTSGAAAAGEVIKTLHQLIDTLSGLSLGSPRGPSPQPPRDMPLLLDAAEAANALSLSRAKVCAMASNGEIPSVRIGRSVRIPRDVLIAWVNDRASESTPRRGEDLPRWATNKTSSDR
jgi:excisionase family DNA binding protein